MVTYGSCGMLWVVVIPVGAGPIERWWPASLDGSQSGAGWAITSSEGLVGSYGFSDWQLAVGRLEHIHHIFPPFTKLEKLIVWCSMFYDICMAFVWHFFLLIPVYSVSWSFSSAIWPKSSEDHRRHRCQVQVVGAIDPRSGQQLKGKPDPEVLMTQGS